MTVGPGFSAGISLAAAQQTAVVLAAGPLMAWFNSTVGLVQSGGVVSSWTDVRGGLVAVPNGAVAPGYTASGGSNGRPAVVSDTSQTEGLSVAVGTTLLSTTNGYTMLVRAQHGSEPAIFADLAAFASATRVLCAVGTNSSRNGISTARKATADTSTTTTGTGAVDALWHTYGTVVDFVAGTVRYLVDNVVIATANLSAGAGVVAGGESCGLGILCNPDGGNNAAATVSEVLFYGAPLPAYQLALLNTYLAR